MITESDLTDNEQYIMRYALTLTRGNADEAKDLTQDVMMKAWEKRHQFTNGSVRAWMRIITRNHFISYHHRIKQNTPAMIDIDECKKGVSDVDKDLSDELTYALKKVRPLYRKLLKMRIEGYQYNEIAEQVDMPIGTVKCKIHLMKKELQTILNRVRK